MYQFSACFITIILTLSNKESNGFTINTPKTASMSTSSSKLNMGFGDMFKGAFSNDENIGPAENAGLKGGVKYNEKVTVNGKSVKAVIGQKVGIAANAARVKINYDCSKGDCGTCKINVNGRTVKVCMHVMYFLTFFHKLCILICICFINFRHVKQIYLLENVQLMYQYN